MLHYKPAINYKTLTCKLSSISDIKVKNAATKCLTCELRLCKLKPTIKYFSCHDNFKCCRGPILAHLR